MAGDWRRLHNEVLHNLYTSPVIIHMTKSRRIKWVGHLAFMRELRNAYNVLIRKPERNRPLRRCRCRWEGNIRMDLKEIGWEGVDWMHLAEDMDHFWSCGNTVMNHRVP
jgi:hypothetical protein